MTRKVETKKKEVNSDEWLKGTYYNQVLFSSSAPLELEHMSRLDSVACKRLPACGRVRGQTFQT